VRDIRETVIVTVVVLAIALNAKDIDACFLILRNDTGVEIGIYIVCPLLGKSGGVLS
jgi:hypothetical protein